MAAVAINKVKRALEVINRVYNNQCEIQQGLGYMGNFGLCGSVVFS